MYLGKTVNRFGVPISLHQCDTCGQEFDVCPAIPEGAEGWDNCMDELCPSYDPNRDADKFFDDGIVHKEPTFRLN